ncbi:MAG: hydrogenase maturation nickel metallochaperone HypA [Desulfobacterales bacterium]|nr:hydrogenase maturation nickel metallochaperone HypA [Desulfobacterales bacterium]
MHEMGIALQIIDVAVRSIPKTNDQVQVEAVHLRIGKLSAVVPQSLTFCFDITKKDTPLANAKLQIEEIPITAKCRDCGHEMIITEAFFKCSQCQEGKLEILSGRELDIVSITLSDTER